MIDDGALLDASEISELELARSLLEGVHEELYEFQPARDIMQIPIKPNADKALIFRIQQSDSDDENDYLETENWKMPTIFDFDGFNQFDIFELNNPQSGYINLTPPIGHDSAVYFSYFLGDKLEITPPPDVVFANQSISLGSISHNDSRVEFTDDSGHLLMLETTGNDSQVIIPNVSSVKRDVKVAIPQEDFDAVVCLTTIVPLLEMEMVGIPEKHDSNFTFVPVFKIIPGSYINAETIQYEVFATTDKNSDPAPLKANPSQGSVDVDSEQLSFVFDEVEFTSQIEIEARFWGEIEGLPFELAQKYLFEKNEVKEIISLDPTDPSTPRPTLISVPTQTPTPWSIERIAPYYEKHDDPEDPSLLPLDFVRFGLSILIPLIIIYLLISKPNPRPEESPNVQRLLLITLFFTLPLIWSSTFLGLSGILSFTSFSLGLIVSSLMLFVVPVVWFLIGLFSKLILRYLDSPSDHENSNYIVAVLTFGLNSIAIFFVLPSCTDNLICWPPSISHTSNGLLLVSIAIYLSICAGYLVFLGPIKRFPWGQAAPSN